MNNAKYAKAYTEVLEIISYFPQDEYRKIPNNLIEYYKNNMDKNYSFSINPEIDIEKQKISKEAYAIIISIFRDFFATDKQKDMLKNLLRQNQEKKDAELREKYNPDNVFKNKVNIEKREIQNFEETRLTIVQEEKWYKKIFNMIKNIFYKKK